MRTVWARMIAIAASIVVALALVACGGGNNATDDQDTTKAASSASVEGLHTDGVLTVGLRSTTGEPLVRRGTSSVDGLYVDVAGAMADQMGVSVRFVEARSVTSALEENCDIVMDVSSSDSDDVQVIGDVTESSIALFRIADQTSSAEEEAEAEESDKDESDDKSKSKDKDTSKTKKTPSGDATITAADLEGTRIALQESSASQRALQLSGVGAEEVAYDTLDEAFAALRDGDVDYVVCSASSGAYLGQRYDNVEFVGCLTQPESMGIAVAKGKGEPQDTLAAAFKSIDGDGVLSEVRRRWLGDFPHLTSKSVITGLPTLEEGEEEEEDPWADFNYSDYDSENLGSATMDGSSAGANAATVSNEE